MSLIIFDFLDKNANILQVKNFPFWNPNCWKKSYKCAKNIDLKKRIIIQKKIHMNELNKFCERYLPDHFVRKYNE